MKFNSTNRFLKIILILMILISPILQLFHDTPISHAASGYTGEQLAAQALSHVGAGYSQGSDRYGPTYFDCSGLVRTSIQELTGSTEGTPTYTGAWATLINNTAVGSIVTIGGMDFKLVAKNVTITGNPEYFETPGTIILFDGHAGISLGRYEWQGTWYDTVDYVVNEIVDTYGEFSAIVSAFGGASGLRAKIQRGSAAGFYGQDCISINGAWQTGGYSPIWKVDALNTNWGVAINNTAYGKSADSTTVLGVWEPVREENGTVYFTKNSEFANLPVKGAVFNVYDSEANAKTNDGVTGYVGTFTTDENGKAEMELPLDTYFYVRETVTPKGFVVEENKIWEIYISSSLGSANITLSNQEFLSGTVTITKKDSVLGTSLSGAVFVLYEWSEGSSNYEAVGTLSYNKDGMYVLDGYKPCAIGSYIETTKLIYTQDNVGKFKVVETTNPTNYSGTWEQAFELTEDGKSFHITDAKNDPFSATVTITKTDSTFGEKLSGAVFTLYEWSKSDGNYASVGTLEDNGDGTYSLSGYTPRTTGTYFTTKELIYTQNNVGKFKIVETKNPTNYSGTWEKEITLSTIGQQLTYEVTNTLEIVSLTLIKRIKASDIVWGNGNPTFIFKVTGTDIQNHTHTYYKAIVFTKSYVDAHTDSSGYVSMSVTFADMIAGNYTGSEEIVARYKFESISDVTNGVVNEETVTFDLVNNSTASAIFTNRKYEWGGFSHNSCVINKIK